MAGSTIKVEIEIKTGKVVGVEGPYGEAATPVDEIEHTNAKLVKIKKVHSFSGVLAETNPTCYYYWWDGVRWWIIPYEC
jgi:hypothetical protein